MKPECDKFRVSIYRIVPLLALRKYDTSFSINSVRVGYSDKRR